MTLHGHGGAHWAHGVNNEASPGSRVMPAALPVTSQNIEQRV